MPYQIIVTQEGKEVHRTPSDRMELPQIMRAFPEVDELFPVSEGFELVVKCLQSAYAGIDRAPFRLAWETKRPAQVIKLFFCETEYQEFIANKTVLTIEEAKLLDPNYDFDQTFAAIRKVMLYKDHYCLLKVDDEEAFIYINPFYGRHTSDFLQVIERQLYTMYLSDGDVYDNVTIS